MQQQSVGLEYAKAAASAVVDHTLRLHTGQQTTIMQQRLD
jgi:hypothetical protein